jgi:hypothetical protein
MNKRMLLRSVVVVAFLTIGVAGFITYLLLRQATIRQELFEELRPVTLSRCQFERFGEPNDGGYLMCSNLLSEAKSAYSYGISGYDGWGCDVSRKFGIPVHEYDCFDLRQPNCGNAEAIFHGECVGGERKVDQGRVFDTVTNQLGKNGDTDRRLVVKMDVEGSEWESLSSMSDAALQRIDQLVVEFHHYDRPFTPLFFIMNEEPLPMVRRLKTVFYVAHVHFNNFSCTNRLQPLPAWAYEVLFVNKRLDTIDSNPGSHAVGFDSPNDPRAPDCQVAFR